jgi:hypothetical protein
MSEIEIYRQRPNCQRLLAYSLKRRGQRRLRLRITQRFSLAHHAEVVVENSHRSIRVNGKVLGLMYEEIVPGALTNNSEIVDESVVSLAIPERILEALPRNACRMILVACGLADANDPLRLKMCVAADIVSVDCE